MVNRMSSYLYILEETEPSCFELSTEVTDSSMEVKVLDHWIKRWLARPAVLDDQERGCCLKTQIRNYFELFAESSKGEKACHRLSIKEKNG
jgi:hypothetical protein